MGTDNNKEKALSALEDYWKHASVLRHWFVFYGIGALALSAKKNPAFFTDNKVNNDFIFWIVAGISLQILLTFLNKIIHWYVYRGENSNILKNTRRYSWANTISNWFWIDITFDILTIFCYVCAFLIFKQNI